MTTVKSGPLSWGNVKGSILNFQIFEPTLVDPVQSVPAVPPSASKYLPRKQAPLMSQLQACVIAKENEAGSKKRLYIGECRLIHQWIWKLVWKRVRCEEVHMNILCLMKILQTVKKGFSNSCA